MLDSDMFLIDNFDISIYEYIYVKLLEYVSRAKNIITQDF